MEFSILRKTMLEVRTNHLIILVSYQTPVACYDLSTNKWYKSATKHSPTTSRHINEWTKRLGMIYPNWNLLPQEYFNNIFEEQ